MKAATRPMLLDVVGLMAQAWLYLRLAVASLQLRLVDVHRRRAAAELVDAVSARLAAQDEYSGRIQCLDTRQEQLMEQIDVIRSNLQREVQPVKQTLAPSPFYQVMFEVWALEEEIEALHRIANFHGRHCVAQMDETPSFYTIAVDHAADTLTARVDFFLQYQVAKPLLTQVEADILHEMMYMPLKSDDLVLQLTVQPATKEAYQSPHCAVRMLLSGASVPTLGETMDRHKFLRRLQTATEWNCILAPLQLDFIPSRTHNY